MSQALAAGWAPSAIAPATVRSVVGAGVGVEGTAFGAVTARLATAGAYQPEVGDSVLVAAGEGGFYVIGVLRALRAAEHTLRAVDGSSAVLEETEEGARWQIRDPAGALVFEHRADRSVVHVPRDLSLRAAGDLELAAAGDVRIESDGRLLARAAGLVALTSIAAGESHLHLDGDRTILATTTLDASAERVEAKIGDATLVARTARTVAERVIERAELVERTAGRVVTRAREMFTEIEEVGQTKAGRLRLVAEDVLSLLGRRTTVKAREHVKIDGEKIHLG